LPDFDLVIVGAGPGGYVAALRAASLGLKTALVEERELGGTCLQRGCIPTKAFIECARAVRQAREAKRLGFSVGDLAIDFAAMRERKNRIVKGLEKGVAVLLAKRGVEVIGGRGKLLSPAEIEVSPTEGDNRKISTKSVILATGSRPAALPLLPVDGERILDSDSVLDAGKLPESLAVIGGGILGCEFAALFAQLGVKVAVVEMLDRLLPTIDADCAAEVTRALRRLRVKAHLGVKLEGCKVGSPCELALSNGKKLEAGTVLVAVGRRPNSESLGLEAAGVETDRGFVKVDKRCRTNVSGIWAVGDLTGGWMLAHAASRMGLVAAADAAGRLGEERYEFDEVPGAVFTDPEIGSVGLTATQAAERGLDAVETKFPFRGLGRAHCGPDAAGLAKIVHEKGSGKVLGVHIAGAHATDLLAEGALAVAAGLTVERLAATVHAHPTYAEALYECAALATGRPLHSV